MSIMLVVSDTNNVAAIRNNEVAAIRDFLYCITLMGFQSGPLMSGHMSEVSLIGSIC